MEKFVVEIERTEKYYTKVLVEATDELDARRRAVAFDEDNGLEAEWNELQPEVGTTYTAYDMDEAHLIYGEAECMTVIK